MFGTGYQIRESSQLPCGKYRARINKAEYVNRNGYDMIIVHLDISGHPNCKPDEISFFDRPTYGDRIEELQTSWDVKMTTFFHSFNLQPGNWNVNTWYGAVGEVVCYEDKKNNQYRVLRAVYENQSVPQSTKQQPQQIPQNVQQMQQSFAGTIEREDYNDIPF